MLCTIEKANSFLNKLVSEHGLEKLPNLISAVIIDEFHTIGDRQRGYYIESMITKLLYLKNIENLEPIQIVGMSATLPNLDEICQWMDATLYMTNFRPVEVNEYIKVGHQIFTTRDFVNQKYDEPVTDIGFDSDWVKQTKHDRYKILPLILETVTNKASPDALTDSNRTGSVLVFCSSKNECERICYSLCYACTENNVTINKEQYEKLLGK
jgi:superfamily II RNA helicase